MRRTARSVEAEYVGEPRPSGLVGRILAPGGGLVRHWDRFFLPSVAQVEYRLGDVTHFLITALCTPVSDFHTRLSGGRVCTTHRAAFCARCSSRWAAHFEPDARILAKQSETCSASAAVIL